ncbi:MAG: protein kinase [Fuerstiella sp.]
MPNQTTDLWNRITLEALVRETEDFRVYDGSLDLAPARITILTKHLVEQSAFRAAFRTDIRQLQQLDHPNIASTIDWGEHDGAIFYVNQSEGKFALDLFLEQHVLTWEEFVDIAWQISSALQHVHNAGFTHGNLEPSSVLIDDALRMNVCDFGLHRWIRQSQHPEIVPLFPDAAQQDIVQFGDLLDWLMKKITSDATDQIRPEVADIKNLIRLSTDPRNNVMARDFQGHLGNLLLQDTGDVIDMVDHRQGQQTSRRSIVDELFDDETEFLSQRLKDLKLPNQPDYLVGGLILALVGIIATLLMLGF